MLLLPDRIKKKISIYDKASLWKKKKSNSDNLWFIANNTIFKQLEYKDMWTEPMNFSIQSNLDYPDLDHPDFFLWSRFFVNIN